jgi:Na+-translocating ferredoxin:NAD+ oxidoreductase subunit B
LVSSEPPRDAGTASTRSLAEALDAALPQTQCTRCGYPDCRRYAQAMADDAAAINQCPPGGNEGIIRLARLTGRPVLPLNPAHGVEGPRRIAVIDETWCIGCTLCIKACPVDCIVGASKQMHTVIEGDCTGCELCIPACPVDCISLENVTGSASGWQAWSADQAQRAQAQYRFRSRRLERAREENDLRLAERAQQKLADLAAASQLTDPAALQRKQAVVEAALARARARQASSADRQDPGAIAHPTGTVPPENLA